MNSEENVELLDMNAILQVFINQHITGTVSRRLLANILKMRLNRLWTCFMCNDNDLATNCHYFNQMSHTVMSISCCPCLLIGYWDTRYDDRILQICTTDISIMVFKCLTCLKLNLSFICLFTSFSSHIKFNFRVSTFYVSQRSLVNTVGVISLYILRDNLRRKSEHLWINGWKCSEDDLLTN